MTTFFIAFGIFALALVGLSLGVILNKRPIKGSCGGLGQIPGVDSDCGGTCRAGGKSPDRPCPGRATRNRTDAGADRRATP